MPSPFPGMDPFLEGSLWGSVHHQLIAEIARQLVPLLRTRYIALSQERFVTLMPEAEDGVSIMAVQGRGPVYPDVSVTQTATGVSDRAAGAAVAAPIEMETLMPERVPQVTLEIRDQASRELVTAIEVLSPTNKRSNGREEYLDKRAKYLLSRAHLVEIDLLRTGQRLPMVGQLPSAPYFAFVSRAWKRPICEVWPIALGERYLRLTFPWWDETSTSRWTCNGRSKPCTTSAVWNLRLTMHDRPRFNSTSNSQSGRGRCSANICSTLWRVRRAAAGFVALVLLHRQVDRQ
jgi:hypothetical protein